MYAIKMHALNIKSSMIHIHTDNREGKLLTIKTAEFSSPTTKKARFRSLTISDKIQVLNKKGSKIQDPSHHDNIHVLNLKRQD